VYIKDAEAVYTALPPKNDICIRETKNGEISASEPKWK
jgi:hypothetical protein